MFTILQFNVVIFINLRICKNKYSSILVKWCPCEHYPLPENLPSIVRAALLNASRYQLMDFKLFVHV